jgi:hypothetical protein
MVRIGPACLLINESRDLFLRDGDARGTFLFFSCGRLSLVSQDSVSGRTQSTNGFLGWSSGRCGHSSGNNAHIFPLCRIHPLESIQPVGRRHTLNAAPECPLVILLRSSQSSLVVKKRLLLRYSCWKREDRLGELASLVGILVQPVMHGSGDMLNDFYVVARTHMDADLAGFFKGTLRDEGLAGLQTRIRF